MSDAHNLDVHLDVEASPLERLVRALVAGRVLTLSVGHPGFAGDPRLDYPWPDSSGPIFRLPVVDELLGSVPDELVAAAGALEQGSVLVDTLSGSSRVTRRNERGTARGPAAVIAEALGALPAGTRVVLLAPSSILSSRTAEAIRDDLLDQHGVSSIIRVGGQVVPGVHTGFELALVVCQVRTPSAAAVRLVDLRGLHPHQWAQELESSTTRRRDVARTVMVQRGRLASTPWLIEGFSRAYSAIASDAAHLGELRPFEELADFLVGGVGISRASEAFRRVEEGQECPDGYIDVIGGGSIRLGGLALPGRFWAKRDQVPERALVETGDIVLRRIVSSRDASGPKVVAAVVPDGVEATFDTHVIRIRWKPSVPHAARELILAWLASEQGSISLSARHVGLHLQSETLRRLLVPLPSDLLLRALDELKGIEDWYLERAAAVRDARGAIFGAARYGDVVPLVVSAQRLEGERVRAAEDSQRFAYRVRNYYPHPIALRYEKISTVQDGEERSELVLDCAEHIVHFLALCGLVQLRALRPTESIPSRCLASSLRTNARMSWGASWGAFQEAVAASKNGDNALALPFPGMSIALDEHLEDGERLLRAQRNSRSHLHRTPDSEGLSRRLSEALDVLLRGVAFLTDVPFVFVQDYAFDELSRQRTGALEFLRGASVVFERRHTVVGAELPRGALGLLGHDGAFHAVGPWLIQRACEVCKRPEIFLFNRFERDIVSYVAMETGHTWITKDSVFAFERLLGPHE
jgi:hypothetical protein